MEKENIKIEQTSGVRSRATSEVVEFIQLAEKGYVETRNFALFSIDILAEYVVAGVEFGVFSFRCYLKRVTDIFSVSKDVSKSRDA